MISSAFALLTAALLISASPLDRTSARSLTCKTQSQPNPIAAIYPDQVTGTLNGTLAVLPIPLAEAQKIVGENNTILTAAYRELLPSFPEGMYPALLQALRDHDVQDFKVGIPDFSRISIEFPFIDLLHDGYTSFRYVAAQATTATQTIALAGTFLYGIKVKPATFDPSCDGYASSSSDPDFTYLNAYTPLTGRLLASTSFRTLKESGTATYPLEFYKNYTNQPESVNGKVCDNMLRFFNTSVTVPPSAPVTVVGNVTVASDLYPGGRVWTGVEGVRIDTAYIEKNYVNCQTLQGYSGTGPGD